MMRSLALALLAAIALSMVPCLRPYPADRMEAFPLSTLVSSPQNEGKKLVEPVAIEDA